MRFIDAKRSSTGVNVRTGSHNLVVGTNNNYSGVGGVVFGFYNAISHYGACVVGGDFNTASGAYASVSGGKKNEASAPHSSVSGGTVRSATGRYNRAAGGLFQTE